jgi:hypothetical protein
MIRNRNIVAAAISLALSLSAPPLALQVQAAQAQEALVPAAYPLTSSIAAEVRSVVNEQTAEGTRIGAVVSLYNNGKSVVRVPDYEVRVRCEDGTDYVIPPSALNALAIEPKEHIELTYMAIIDTLEPIPLAELAWVQVNKYVFPETVYTQLAIPISTIVWRGQSFAPPDETAWHQWGEPFKLPALSASLELNVVNVYAQETPQGYVSVAVISVENQDQLAITIPDFELTGRSGGKMFSGSRLEQGKLILQAGDKRNIHYAIPTESNAKLASLTVMMNEKFVGANQKSIPYSVGLLTIGLSGVSDSLRSLSELQPYRLNDPIAFDPRSQYMPPAVQVSLAELHVLESKGDGYKVVNAKFKLSNNSDQSVPAPKFQAELMTSNGNSYTPLRSGAVVETLLPQLGVMTSSTFIVPGTEVGESFGLVLTDTQSAAPYKVPIAAFRAQVQQEPAKDTVLLYPFRVQFKEGSLQRSMIMHDGEFKYSFRIKLALNMERTDKVMTDQSLSNVKLELTDKEGKVLGKQQFPLAGDNKLVNGEQTIRFNDLEDNYYDVLLNIYESIDTPYGTADRLITTLKY